MATNLTKSVCGVCKQQDINRIVAYWCPHCGEGLCTTCNKVHANLKISKNQEVLPIEDHEKLPRNLQARKHTCTVHELTSPAGDMTRHCV